MDLITRRIIHERENGNVTEDILNDYVDTSSQRHKELVESIRKELNLTSLNFLSVEDLIDSIGLPAECVCTHCWTGKF